MKIKVLIADKFPDKYISELNSLDLEVIYQPKFGEKDLPEAAKDVDILVVRSTIVNEETINNSQKLNLIIRAGSGVNNINISAANKKRDLCCKLSRYECGCSCRTCNWFDDFS